MAQKSRREYPKAAPQSKLVNVSLQDGKVSTEAGFPILEGVSGAFTARKDNSMPAAIVLSLSSQKKVSILDQPLGRLNCKRQAFFPLKMQKEPSILALCLYLTHTRLAASCCKN